MERRTELIIHQTLHGYADGHTLLASSCDLSSAEKRALLIMSDLSGTNLDQNFSSYLTGYALPGNRYYALGRTWYAPEMKRPGCVWTQTLLVSLPLLGRIKQLHSLNSLFFRPSVGYVEPFSRAISIDELATPSIDRPDNQYGGTLDASILHISSYLYSFPEKPIVVPSDSATSYEKAILAVWSLQWPRLRRKFSFCTGALSLRKLDGKLLDCQSIPKPLLGTILRREVISANVVDFNYPLENSLWMLVLRQTKPIALSSFMHRYGSDITGGRGKFKPLCLAFELSKETSLNSTALETYISFFNDYFPRPEEAKRLKRDLILKKIEQADQDVYNTVLTLLNSPSLSVFINTDWKIVSKIIKLWQDSALSTEQLSVLLQAIKPEQLTPDDKLVLTDKLPIKSWLLADWLSENLVIQLLSIRPHLIESHAIWQSSPSNVQQMWLSAAQHIAGVDWDNVLVTMVETNNTSYLEQVAKNISPQRTVDLFGKLIDKGHPFIKENPMFLNNYIYSYLDWLENYPLPSPYTLDFIRILLLDGIIKATELPQKIIISLSDFASRDIYFPDHVRLMALLLVNCFNNKLINSQEVVTLLFQPFHSAGQQNLIDPVSWKLITFNHTEEEIRRPVGLFAWFFDQYKPGVPTWDKCGKLRQILVESFILYKWDESTIIKVVTEKTIFQQLINYCLTFSSGIAFLIRIDKALNANRNIQSTFHSALISKSLDSRARKQ